MPGRGCSLNQEIGKLGKSEWGCILETKLSSILINMNKCLNMFHPIGEDLSVSYLTFNILQILVFVEGFPTIFRAALLIYSWRRKCQIWSN